MGKKKIIHKLIRKKWGGYTGINYLCNQAVGITPSKCSYRWKEVNCKNCLRVKK